MDKGNVITLSALKKVMNLEITLWRTKLVTHREAPLFLEYIYITIGKGRITVIYIMLTYRPSPKIYVSIRIP